MLHPTFFIGFHPDGKFFPLQKVDGGPLYARENFHPPPPQKKKKSKGKEKRVGCSITQQKNT